MAYPTIARYSFKGEVYDMKGGFYLSSLSDTCKSIEGPFTPGTCTVIGRGDIVTPDKQRRARCSHQQVRLTVSPEGKALVARMKGALNPTVVNEGTPNEHVLAEEEEVEIKEGDTLSLINNKFPFQLKSKQQEEAVPSVTGKRKEEDSAPPVEKKGDNKKPKLIFTGMKMLIGVRGEITNGVRQILENQIKARGGQVVSDISKCTHIVIDTSLKPEIIRDTLKVKSLPAGVPLVNKHWIHDGFIRNELQPLPPAPTESIAVTQSTIVTQPDSIVQSLDTAPSVRREETVEGDVITFNEKHKRYCIMPSPLDRFNTHITSVLKEIADLYQTKAPDGIIQAGVGDQKGKAFQMAICKLASLNFKLSSAEDLEKVQREQYLFTEHMQRRIEEIIATGTCSTLENLKKDEVLVAARKLKKLYGVGNETARTYAELGCRSKEDILRLHESGVIEHIPVAVQFGIKHADDIDRKMDRETAIALVDTVNAALHEIDPEYMTMICGGFRRGKEYMKDIDLVITKKSGNVTEDDNEIILEHLRQKGIIHTVIVEGSGVNRSFDNLKYRGIRPHDHGRQIVSFLLVYDRTRQLRRLDLIVVPLPLFPYATLGWTGSILFERAVRHYAANELGIAFSSNGMFYIDPQKSQGRWIEGLQTEEDIFRKLRIPYIPPELRNCG